MQQRVPENVKLHETKTNLNNKPKFCLCHLN